MIWLDSGIFNILDNIDIDIVQNEIRYRICVFKFLSWVIVGF